MLSDRMNYDLALFDLDGTLTDPGEGITNSVAYALREMGITPPPREQLYKFIGPPLVDSFKAYFGMSEADAEEAVRLYRVYFADTGIFENEPYPGAKEMLVTLKNAGVKLTLATSKPIVFARRILERYGFAEYFDFAAGSELDGTRASKADVVRYALDISGEYSRAIMVGDRMHDVHGAAEHSLECIGVLYGYGSREELEEAGAKYIAANPEEVVKFIL